MPYPGAADLGAAYESDTGKKAGQILGPEYAAAQIMMQAISKAGGTEPQAIVDALAATDGTFVCGPVKFDANHTVGAEPGRRAVAGRHLGADLARG